MTITFLGVDCDAPPDYAALAAQHFSFAGRYLAPHDNPLTRAELAAAAAHNIGIVMLCEHQITDVQGGAAAGKANAEQWVASANDLHAPNGAVLVAACDEDPSIVGETAAKAYYGALEAECHAAAFLGGAYGGVALMKWVAPIVSVLMQSGAWSGAVKAPGIALYQRIQTERVGNVDCDVDEAYVQHFGAFNASGLWPKVVTPPKPPAPKPVPQPAPKPAPVPAPLTADQYAAQKGMVEIDHAAALMCVHHKPIEIAWYVWNAKTHEMNGHSDLNIPHPPTRLFAFKNKLDAAHIPHAGA
jgi:hypothetical protein